VALQSYKGFYSFFTLFALCDEVIIESPKRPNLITDQEKYLQEVKINTEYVRVRMSYG